MSVGRAWSPRADLPNIPLLDIGVISLKEASELTNTQKLNEKYPSITYITC